MTPNDLATKIAACILHARVQFVTGDKYLAWREALEELAPKHVSDGHRWSSSSVQDAHDVARACGNADQIWAIFVMLFPDLVDRSNRSE